MKRFILAALAALWSVAALAQIGSVSTSDPTYDATSQMPLSLTTAGRLRSDAVMFNGTSWDNAFTCPSTAVVNVSAAATTEIVALTAAKTIRVCSFAITVDTAATTAKFVYGTGTNCGSGTADITGAMRFVDEGGMALSAPAGGSLFRTASANALCLTAATGAVTGFVTYAKF